MSEFYVSMYDGNEINMQLSCDDDPCDVPCDQQTIDLINWNLDQDDYERKRSEEQMGGCNCDCDCDGYFDCPGGGCM